MSALGNIAAAQSAKIGKKTASQIASLDKEEADKAAAKKKERDDKIKQKNENDAAYAIRKEKLKQAEILLGITDQYEKERKIAEFKLKDDIRIAEEDLTNKKITNKQKLALVEQYHKDEAAKIKEINDKEAAAKKKEEEEKKKQEAIDAKKKADDEKADAKKKLDEAKAAASDQSLKANERRALLDAERALNQEYYDK